MSKTYLTSRIICPYCGHDHNDEDKLIAYVKSNGEKSVKNFGREPHSTHLCAYCKNMFPDPYGKSIGGKLIQCYTTIVTISDALLPEYDNQLQLLID